MVEYSVSILIFKTKIDKHTAMSHHLVNKTGARKTAKNLGVRISQGALDKLNDKLLDVIKEASERAMLEKRKTILERDIILERELFS
jgi:histone H3/H4